MSSNIIPRVAFLGLCEKGESIREGDYRSWYHNLIGINSNCFCLIFPINLKEFKKLVFAIYDVKNLKDTNLEFLDQNGLLIQKMSLKYHEQGINKRNLNVDRGNTFSIKVRDLTTGWSLFLCDFEKDIILSEPTTLNIFLEQDGEKIPIGSVTFHYQKVPPLSKERIAALKADPAISKKIAIQLGCKNCKAELKIYVGLERDKVFEEKGDIWFEDLPDIFSCKCRNSSFSLKYIRENFHALLGKVKNGSQKIISAQNYYTKASIIKIIDAFKLLIESNPGEEEVQKFIERNTLILSLFSPEMIYNKMPILSKYKTDFCIVTNRKDLLLIEIEKPSFQIMKKNGETKREMQHALDQVNNWIHLVSDEKSAVLKGIGNLKVEDINRVKGVLIMGCEKDYEQEKLREFKSRNLGEVSFYTYDDLLRGLNALAKNIDNLD
ncbi:DUF4263 domain-containing protein [Candidatus Woesearchaeota archaeon]|nr:DUF4263 domain-containing protein [Candidatus Woesearchaeota archaeon]